MRGKYKKLLVFWVILALGAGFAALTPARKTEAAINPQINFQGKLTNPDGTNVTDGTYSIRFRIYADPSADAANTCSANSCKWEETQSSVSVSSGIFQVSLGSSTALPGSVNFNAAGLYLGVKVGSDAEMTPRITFTAAPYAFNADQVDGLDATNIVQLATGVQTDSSSTNASIAINKTGTAGLVDLRSNSNSVFSVANDGSTTIKSQTNSATVFQIQNTSGVPIFVGDTTNPVNLLSNPGFETGTTGWTVGGTAASGAINNTKSNTYFGAASLKVTTATAASTTITVNTFTSAIPAGIYTFSFYANASTTIAGLSVSFGSGTCTPNPNVTSIGAGSFQRYSCTVTTTAATSSIVITVTTNSATLYIDAAQLQTGSTTTPYYIGGLQLRGVITNPVSIQPISDSSTVFQVAANNGSRLLTVDSEAVGDPLEVQIGSNSVIDTTQVLLALDSFDSFADTATCGTANNQGSLYYNTKSNAIRGCINGAWEDLVSTGGLGLQLFGVVPDSGLVPGDIYGVSGAQNGPCKVSVGSATTIVSWTGCTAYSGGRKVIVAAGSATTTNATAGNFQHLCLTGTNAQPVLSTSGSETANLATVSMPSMTNPILCLADIKFTNANNTITQVYDTRTYTTTNKISTAMNSAAGVGALATYTTTKGTMVIAPSGAGASGIAGVVVSSNGSASTTTINAIVATSGPAAVKAISGTNTVGTYITTSGTAGYATTATTRATPGTAVFYSILGNTRTAWAGATACAANSDACAASVVTDIGRN